MVFAFMLCLLTACGNNDSDNIHVKVTPTYRGMTISKTAQEASFSSVSGAMRNADSDSDEAKDFTVEADGEISEDMQDLITVEVNTDDEIKYYVSPGETFIVQVHLSNPDQFEIQSFTLNGVKYASYMFRQGSTMELLLLEVAAPITSGYMDLTIDAIKYIDGTEIKDVKMDGGKTIKAGVMYEHAPTVTVSDCVIDTTSIAMNVEIIDNDNIVRMTTAKIYLTDGENHTFKQLIRGVNNIKFDNLTMGKQYKYGVVMNYDVVDGRGDQAHWYEQKSFATLKAFNVTDVEIGRDKIDFTIEKTGSVGEITDIKLLETNGAVVKEMSDLSSRTFDKLLSDHNYKIEIAFSYVLAEETKTDKTTIGFKTPAKTAPTVTVKDTSSTQTSISFAVETTDTDSISEITKIELYNGEELVKALDKDATSFKIGELLSGTMYTIKITYNYDLNDGEGVHTELISADYPTLVSSVAVSEMAIVNNTQIKLGEELNLMVYFDNPSDIELVNIYVNDIKVNVAGGDRKTYAIVRFVPDEAGLVDFYVDKVEYNYNGILVTQSVDSLAHVPFPVFNDLDVSFEGVSANPYEYTGDGVYLTFDNPHDYKVFKINNSNDFIRISDNQFYISDNDRTTYWESFKIESIEYGYDNYGTTSQAFTFSVKRSPCGGYSEISTAEDFLNMTEGGYYILANDLDLRAVNITQTIKFAHFNGNGHTVRGLHNVIDSASQNYYDIFDGKSMFDVNFTEVYFSYVNNKSEEMNINLLGKGRLYNCTVGGDVNTSGNVGILREFFDEYGQWIQVSSLIDQYDESNTFNLGVTADGELSRLTQAGKRLDGNENIYMENGFLYYGCGNGAKIMLGRYAKDKLVSFVIDDDVIAVKNWAKIANPNLESVSIGDNLIGSIPTNMFEDCAKLTSVKIGNGIMAIGGNAFDGCVGLEDVTIGSGVASIEYRAFFGCVLLTSVVIPDSVITIGEEAFRGCSGLKSVTIGGNVTTIGENAFYECENLIEVDIPDSVESIGRVAFFGCVKFERVTIGEGVKNIGSGAFQNCHALADVTIGNSVESIGEAAFNYCYALNNVVLPDSVKSIGSNAFAYCTALTSIEIPDGAEAIADWAFDQCTELADVTIGKNVKNIGKYAFSSTKITDIIIPDGVESVGEAAFQYCTKLANVTIGNHVKSIGSWAFSYCYDLRSVVIPDSVESIESNAFTCNNMESITIGSGVKKIENNAFSACDVLTSVYYNGTEEEWNKIVIGDTGNECLASATVYFKTDN